MARRRILWLWKSRGNVRVFFIYSYLKDSAFTAVKRAESFKLGEEPIYSTANRLAPD